MPLTKLTLWLPKIVIFERLELTFNETARKRWYLPSPTYIRLTCSPFKRKFLIFFVQ